MTKRKISQTLAALLFCLTLSACGDGEPDIVDSSHPYTEPTPMQEVRISSNFSSVLHQQVAAAAQLWCEAGVRCFGVRTTDPEYANVTPGGIGIDCEHIAIKLNPDAVFTTLAQTMHELGHAIRCGAKHIPEPGHIMSNPEGENPNMFRLTPEDIDWALAE